MAAADSLRVLIAAAECAPLAKTGGLADVVGALPKYLAPLGVEARVILPYHRVIKERWSAQTEHLYGFSVDLGWRSQYAGLEKLELPGLTAYLIDNEFYFNDRVYRGGQAELEQYAFFSRAVLEAIPLLDFSPQVLHLNDWHTAILPLLVKSQYQGRPQGGLRTLLTIHNLFYQGKCGFDFLNDALGIAPGYNNPSAVEHFGCANILKAGVVFADKINTVSPTYAQEIRGQYYGEGLNTVLDSRADDLSGILNGLDYSIFDPELDPALPANFSAADLSGKYRVKAALLRELGLDQARIDTPLLAWVSRLTQQKGVDLLTCVLEEIMANDLALVVLGSGDRGYEDFFRQAEHRYRGRLCAYIGYQEALSHRVYAGADFLLMPSRFEPCGLSQMIAMRYGALPIVRETGGLKDTVLPYNIYTGEGTGFTFANYNAHELAGAVGRALGVYRDKLALATMIQQAMSCQFGFEQGAAAYAELYRQLLD